MSDLQGAIGER